MKATNGNNLLKLSRDEIVIATEIFMTFTQDLKHISTSDTAVRTAISSAPSQTGILFLIL